MDPKWLTWAKQLQAVAQNGLIHTTNPFDIERYHTVGKIASEIVSNHSELSKEAVENLFKGQTGYATPKVALRGATFQDDKVLMVKERLDGKWSLPGGWADVCETPSQGVTREILEESGFETRVIKLAAVYDRSKHPHSPAFPFHVYKLFFICEITGGAKESGVETSEVGFFKEDDLPQISSPRVTHGQIIRMFEHYRNPELPSDLD